MSVMGDYNARNEAQGLVRHKAGLPQTPEERRTELREAETSSIRAAKLAATEAWEEVRELIGEVKALRLAGQLKDPAKSAQNLALTGAVLTDKALLLEGRPTSITEHRDLDDVLRGLQHLAPQAITYDAETTAIELNS